MSRLFREEVGIFIGPSKVLLVKVRGGFRPQCCAEQSLLIEGGSPGNWMPALEALSRELVQDQWHKARVRIVLSDHWAHYDVLPWSVELSKETERLAHARYLLAGTFGEAVEEWKVALSAAAPGAARLISAIPQALLDELHAVCSHHELKIKSLQPQLVVAYNLWRHQLPADAAWLATIDENCLVALHVRDGRCNRVRAVRISDDWELELQRIQTMGRLAQSRPAEGPMFVHAPLCIRSLAGREPAVEWLESAPRPNGVLARLVAMKEVFA